MAEQLIHVVRHAHAGDPSRWTHDDDLRPLSERGCDQAVRLVERLQHPAPGLIVSSPSVRCIATVLPLARSLRLPVTTLDALYEGSSAEAMLKALRVSTSTIVAATHGDVIVSLLALLGGAGLASDGRAEKGSTWTLDVLDGAIRSARYSPPP